MWTVSTRVATARTRPFGWLGATALISVPVAAALAHNDHPLGRFIVTSDRAVFIVIGAALAGLVGAGLVALAFGPGHRVDSALFGVGMTLAVAVLDASNTPRSSWISAA